MMRKILTSFLVFSLFLGQISCRSNEDENSSEENIQLPEKYDFIITPENVQGDTKTYFQKIFSTHKTILIKDGIYDFTLTDGYGVFPQNGATIVFEKNAKIRVKPNALQVYVVLDFRHKKDITLINPQIEGDKYTHTGSGGQWGHAMQVAHCSNIKIYNPKISKMWGDAMEMRNCENIKVYNAHFFDNRRQGISILGGKNIEIRKILVENTGGQNPGYGIDVEPDWNGDGVIGLKIYNATLRNNGNGTYYTGGFSLSTHHSGRLKAGQSRLVPTYFDVELHQPVFEGDALMISSETDYVNGSMKVYQPVFKNSKNTAIYIHNHISDHFKTEIYNPKLENCVTTSRRTIYLNPVLFYVDNQAQKSNGTKNLLIQNPVITASASASYKEYGIRNITPHTFKEDLKNVKILNAQITGYKERFYNHSGDIKTTGTPHSSFVITYQ